MAHLQTRQEAADNLNVSLATIDKLIRKGELPVVKIGKACRIEPSALETLVRERTAVRV